MNRDKLEKWILLEQSGELSARRSAILRRLLDENPEARAWRDALIRISETVRATPPDREPGQRTVQNILREARQNGPSRPPAFDWARWMPRAAYAAAALALAFLGWSGFRASGPAPDSARPAAALLAWDDGFDTQLSELESVMTYTRANWGAAERSDTDENAIAEELLELENGKI